MRPEGGSSWRRAGALALVVALGGCGRCASPPPDPLACRDCNLVVIALTNVRRDHLGLYGYQRPTSPNIDRFFANGLVFDNVFAPASWTLPSAASLFSGELPTSHGVMNRYSGSRLSDEVTTLVEILRSRGYATAGFTGGGDYNRRFNLNQGFDVWADEETYPEHGISLPWPPDRRDLLAYFGIEPVLPGAQTWLAEHAGAPFFLFLQGFDAHCPFTPSPPFDTRFDPSYDGSVDFSNCHWTFERTVPTMRDGQRSWRVKAGVKGGPRDDLELSDRDVEHMVALYDGEIAQTDSLLARLFSTLTEHDVDDRTVVVLLSEHGDLFGEHGRFMRGGPLRGTFYDPVIHIPLAIRHPTHSTRVNVGALMQMTDVGATLLDFLDIEDTRVGAGRSLVPAVRQPGVEVNPWVLAGSRYGVCHNPLWSGLSVVEAVRDHEWKLVNEHHYARDGAHTRSDRELFRIRDDPGEQHNLAAELPATVQRLERILRQHLDPVPLSAPPCPAVPAHRRVPGR